MRFRFPASPLVSLILSFLTMAVGPMAALWAQTPSAVAPGDRLRVHAPGLVGGRIEGILREVTLTELVLLVGGGAGAESRIPLAAITELARAEGTKRSLVVGVLAGSAGGAVIGAAAAGPNPYGFDRGRSDRVGGLVGGVVGGVLGYLHRTTRWNALSLRVVRPHLLAGMVVRVTAHGRPDTDLNGIIAEATADSVVFVPNGGTALRMPRSSISSLAWPIRQRRATRLGVGIGVGIGMIAGAIAGAASGEECNVLFCLSAGQMALVGAVGGGMVGAVAGGAIGYFAHVTVWEAEERREPTLTIAPLLTARRVGLVASVSF